MYSQVRPATMYGIQVDTSTLKSTTNQNRQTGRTYQIQTPTTSSSSRPRLLFYDKDKPYYEFTNFSPHPVYYNGQRYPTSEHLFQSFKVHSTPILFLLIVVLTTLSFKNIILPLQTSYVHAPRDLGRPSRLHVNINHTFVLTGTA